LRRRDPKELFDAATSGDRVAVARLISLVEEGGTAAREVGRLTFPRTGNAYTVGITGAPGAGKSTLTDRLIAEVRSAGDEVGVLAVDPSSPFSGGAFLGDRVRMQDHALDPGVFIRSMASRGHLGGLSLATPEAIRVLDACGRPWVLVETVGVGQVEFEIVERADTTVVVLTPGVGDSVQANKAGLLEVADLFVINKADRAGVHELERDLNNMLEMNQAIASAAKTGDTAVWRPPILRTIASTGEGVAEVWETVRDHRAHLEGHGLLEARRARRLADELQEIVVRRLEDRAFAACSGAEHDRLVRALQDRRLDPWQAADQLLDGLGDRPDGE
jgi:LAO/AO transport system kinase